MLFCPHPRPLLPRHDPRYGRCLAIRGNEWVARIAQGLNVVKVSVADVRVEHEVRLMDFTKWRARSATGTRFARFWDEGLSMNVAGDDTIVWLSRLR